MFFHVIEKDERVELIDSSFERIWKWEERFFVILERVELILSNFLKATKVQKKIDLFYLLNKKLKMEKCTIKLIVFKLSFSFNSFTN